MGKEGTGRRWRGRGEIVDFVQPDIRGRGLDFVLSCLIHVIFRLFKIIFGDCTGPAQGKGCIEGFYRGSFLMLLMYACMAEHRVYKYYHNL